MFKKNFLKFTIEVTAIIIGITVSFWLNQISIENNNEAQRQRVLKNLLIEVDDIDRYCKGRLRLWNQDINIYSSLLDEKLHFNTIEEIAISKSRVEYNLIYFRDFDPPINRYKSMINTGDLKHLNSEEIKEILTRLHNLNLTSVRATVEYEKNLKGQLISLLTLNYPELFSIGNDNNQNLEDYINYLHKFIKEDERLEANLIIQMKYFKTRVSSLKLYMLTLQELKDELEASIELN
tara:strand:+ start:173 stop:880 length:708 start_codon:yes stop_codon:yes gene_type:complete